MALGIGQEVLTESGVRDPSTGMTAVMTRLGSVHS